MKQYTCGDYRQEMILAALGRQLAHSDVGEQEKKRLKEQIRQMESAMGMD